MIARTLIPYALVAAVVGGGVFWVQGLRWDNDVLRINDAHATASTAAVAEALDEQRRSIEAVQIVDTRGEQELEKNHTTDRSDAGSADRLRDELAAIRQRSARDLSNAATQRQTDRQTIDMLSGLYQRADSRARELAAAFEDARARGLTCEATYVAVCESRRPSAD